MAVLAAAAIAGGAARAASAPRRPLTIVALGTSLTARGGWTGGLEAELRREGRAARVVTVAQPGMTSRWGLEQLDRVAAARPDVVLVEFAANDAALQRFTSLDRSRAAMRAIVAGLGARLPGVCVAVMAMNPVSGVRGWVRPMLDRYEDAHLRDARAAGATPIDFRPGWLRIPADRRAAMIPDGLHPLPQAAAAVIVPPLAARVRAMACARKEAM